MYLQRLVGKRTEIADRYLAKHGYKPKSCFNDYKCVWVNILEGKSILAKIYPEEDHDGSYIEVIDRIWCNNYVYDENKREFTNKNK